MITLQSVQLDSVITLNIINDKERSLAVNVTSLSARLLH